MNSDMSQIPLAPIATVVAALITAMIAFVNLTLSKEQKTSEFRQMWIDGLRSDLAVYLSSARAMCRSMQEARSEQTNDEDIQDFKFGKAKINDMRISAANALYRIKLRLNRNEINHSELNRLIENAITIQNRINIEKGSDYSEALAAIERVADHSQIILKSEWERVKKGEKSFHIAKNFVMPAIMIGSAVFIAFLLFNSDRPNQAVDTTPVSAPR